jgi:hypothetical protein
MDLVVFRREPSTSIRDFVCLLVGRLVGSHITLNVILSAVCGRIDLIFDRDVHVDLLFQFLHFFFLSSYSNFSLSSFSSISSEINSIYN